MASRSPAYNNSNNRHQDEIGGQKVWVDSHLEERVLRHLEATGYSGRWRRRDRGISYRGFHYTPDLELAIERSDGTHRALVEIKPSVAYFKGNRDLPRRMLGVAGYYGTDYFLLYAGDENAWYQIDAKSGALSPFVDLTPGKLRIDQLHEPVAFPAWRIYDHHYSARPDVARHAIKWLADTLESFVLAIVGPKKRRRGRRR